MKKLNEDGFTLIEMLVAISIFSIVLIIGYQIINTSTKFMNNQKNVSKNQMSLNTVNEYLNKDLEQSTKIEYPSNAILNNLGENSSYEYVITTKHGLVNNTNQTENEYTLKDITYKVDISKNNNKYLYKLVRKDERSNLELVENKEIYLKNGKIEAPFVINEDESIKGLYNVKINYVDRTFDKQHKFDVVSRYTESDNSQVIPPDVPEIGLSDRIVVENQVIMHNQPGGGRYWQELDKPHYRIGFSKGGEEDTRNVRNNPVRLDTNVKIEYSKDLNDPYDDEFYDAYNDRVMKIEFGNTSQKHFANNNKYNVVFKYVPCKKVMLKVQVGPSNVGPNQSSGDSDKIKFLKLYGVKINGENVGDIDVDTIFEIKNPTDKIVVEIESIERIGGVEADRYEHDDLFVKFGN